MLSYLHAAFLDFAETSVYNSRQKSAMKVELEETGMPGDRGIPPVGERGLGRLRWLIFLRLLVVSFLLGIAAIIQFSGDGSLSGLSLTMVSAVIGSTYLLSLLYMVLPRLGVGVNLNVSLQSSLDIGLITILVYATGGAGSIYSIIYPLVIMYAALFLGRRGTLMVASLAAICYGGLLDLEYFGYLQPLYGETYRYGFSAGYVFSRIFIHIVFFYIVAVLALFVVERERKAEFLLSEQQDSFRRLDLLHRSIIESVSAGIMTVDREGRVRSFNRAAELITGLERSQAEGLDLKQVVPAFEELLLRGEARRVTVEAKAGLPGGGDRILGCSLSPLMDSSMNPIGTIIIFQDLTEVKAMEREIEESKNMAFLGEMAAVLAHELRNPLASIGGSIQLLRRDLQLDGGDKRLMDIIERGRNQLETLAGDFLLLARAQGESTFEDVDVAGLVDETLEAIRLGSDWHEDIRITREHEEEGIVYGNRSEIRQAIHNITANAVQAMPDGGELAVRTRGTVSTGLHILEVQVSDTGPGIDGDIMARIGEPFFTTRKAGTGLGLVIVKRVMENHGGFFNIENREGHGVIAVLGFPRVKTAVTSEGSENGKNSRC